jgi:uncharacterized protein (TIGR02145 family)
MAPVFTVEAGTYNQIQVLQMSSSTEGAVIYYTLDGSEPDTTSPRYLTPLYLCDTVTVKAKAFHTGMNPSVATSAAYVITTTIAPPSFSVLPSVFHEPFVLTLNNPMGLGVFEFSRDSVNWLLYIGQTLEVTQSDTIYARLILDDTLLLAAPYLLQVVTPTYEVGRTMTTNGLGVGISTTTPNSTLRYTLDGSAPTEASPLYTDSLRFFVSDTITTRAFRAGWEPSGLSVLQLVIADSSTYPKVEPPVFSLRSGSYVGKQTVRLSCARAGAKLEYAWNDKSQWSAYPSTGISIQSSGVLYARSIAGGFRATMDSATYDLFAATPTISPATGTYDTAQKIKITSSLTGAVLEYSYDSLTWMPYVATTSLVVQQTGTKIFARARVTGLQDGVSSATYTLKVRTPGFSLPSGKYGVTKFVKLTKMLPNATYYYTLDGTTPTVETLEKAQVYSSSGIYISNSGKTTVKLLGVLEGFLPSSVVSNSYTLQLTDGDFGTFTDPRDNKVYRTTRITPTVVGGYTQIWMSSNLNYTTSSGSTCYGGEDDSCTKYGRTYTWTKATQGWTTAAGVVHDICPDGWHLPSKSEFMNLSSLSGQLRAGADWPASVSVADPKKFTALPAPYKTSSGWMTGNKTSWWTADVESILYLTSRFINLGISSDNFSSGGYLRSDLLSVRCVRDEP